MLSQRQRRVSRCPLNAGRSWRTEQGGLLAQRASHVAARGLLRR